MSSKKTIAVLVSGSIAVYKAVELVRLFKKAGHDVQVVMTQAATQFVTPLTFQTVSGNRVLTSVFDPQTEHEIGHISIADSADLVVLAPATANTLAKYAQGIADDPVTTILLATHAPVLVAPAMNVNMWNHPATQESVALLRSRAVDLMEPGDGELACGWMGQGRFPEVEEIFGAAESILGEQILADTHLVITAGPTREAIDPVRFVSNGSSGRMGIALAEQALRLGATVDLIVGQIAYQTPNKASVTRVTSAGEMADAVFEQILSLKSQASKRTVAIMAAAVTDHRPRFSANEKLKMDKKSSYQLEMVPCVDILSELSNRRDEFTSALQHPLTIVGFSLETCGDEELLSVVSEKRLGKGADIMIGNTVASSLGSNEGEVVIVDSVKSPVRISRNSKSVIAREILGAIFSERVAKESANG